MFYVYCSALTEGTLMAKRRAEDTLLRDSPSKRHSRCGVDAVPETAPPTGGVSLSLSPPSLPPLLGSRCRKRPHYCEEQEQEEAAGLRRKTTHGDTRRKHPANVLMVQTSGSFQDRGRSSSPTKFKKRPREDCAGSETVTPTADDKTVDGSTDTEDCAYNSFQYWRVPLPELDLSLLEDVSGCSQPKQKSKVKDSSSDVMET